MKKAFPTSADNLIGVSSTRSQLSARDIGLNRLLHVIAVAPANAGMGDRRITGQRQCAAHVLSLLQGLDTIGRIELFTPDSSGCGVLAGNLRTIALRENDDWSSDTPDLVIDFGGVLDEKAVTALQRQGARVVNYCSGPDYLMDAELHGEAGSLIPANHDIAYDEIWVTPQVARASFFMMHTLGRDRIKVAPFVWGPETIIGEGGYSTDFGVYEPGDRQPGICVIPQAVDAARSFMFPLLIAESVNRSRLAGLDQIVVRHDGENPGRSDTFASLLGRLDISRNGAIAFEDRPSNHRLLSSRFEMFVSYQANFCFGDEILFLCWMGYPVIHNWELAPDLGYYYRGSDLGEGAKRLAHALETHDSDTSGFRERQRKAMARFLPDNEDLQSKYAQLIGNVLGERNRLISKP